MKGLRLISVLAKFSTKLNLFNGFAIGLVFQRSNSTCVQSIKAIKIIQWLEVLNLFLCLSMVLELISFGFVEFGV